MTQLNYRKLKETFKRTGNTTDYEKLILKYYSTTELDENSADEFLNGVELSENAIATLGGRDALILLCNGVEPKELLIKAALTISIDNSNAFSHMNTIL